MSGSDETFVPPGREEAEPSQARPTDPPPPSFGRATPAEEPVVVFQTADGSSGVPVFTGPALADAEEADAEEPGDVRDTTIAVARAGSSASGPALTPDAILPPGTPPEAPPDPAPDPDATSTGQIPRLGPGTSPPGASSAARRALLAGVGVLGVFLLGGTGVLAYTTLSGGSGGDRPAITPPPAVTRSATASPKPKPKPKRPVPVDIRDEKKDPKPLLTGEVFPHRTVVLAGHTFVRVKAVINDHCDLAANGPFADELMRQHCRRVVRATFVSKDKKLAVTAGIAVMPTDAAASAALKTQDPAHYEWFRGMNAPGASKIDKAGGYATSTQRGRYIGYAYATYADGHKPKSGDKTLKAVGIAFREAAIRPIERRAKD
jgi:hypothetical protein